MQQPITPYINLLSETNDISSIQSILHKCLSDPNVYVGFNEVSSLPNIQQTLQGSNIGQSLLRTLELFSFGVYLDYHQKDGSNNTNNEGKEGETGDKFVKLNDAQEMKLKLLTVVSTVQLVLESGGAVTHGNRDDAEMKVVAASNSIKRRNRRGKHASTNKNNSANTSKNNVGIVHYSVLQKALNLDVDRSTSTSTTSTSNETNRQLEEILIQCIYSNLLPNGTKLDQKQKCIIIQQSNPLSPSSTSPSGPTSTLSNDTTTSTPESDVLVLCRDVNLQSIPSMISKLDTFYKRSERVKDTLQKSLNDLRQGMKEDVEKWKRVESMIQTTKAKIAGDENNGGGGMDIVENDSMYDSYGGKRHSKRSRGGRSNRLNFGSRV